MTDLLPLFPLAHVLMPGIALPLRIFEPRYRRLLDDVTSSGTGKRFGVVALTAGLEVETVHNHQEPQFAQVGTVAEILEVHPASDDTVSVLTGGSQRFRIVQLVDTGLPYLRAEVVFLPELAGPMPATLPAAVRALAAEYSRLLGQLTGRDPAEAEPYPTDDILLSYRLAMDAPLAPKERQQLLEDDTATARLLDVQRVMRREVVLLRRTRTIAVSPGLLQASVRLN